MLLHLSRLSPLRRTAAPPLPHHRTHLYTLVQHPFMASNLRQRTAKGTTAPAVAVPSSTRSHSGHSHSHGGHSHGEEEATALLSALQGSTDPGSRITLIGLAANVGLTGVKGAAGWVLGSAALLADAAHSGSDLLADIVTLTTYRMSRKPVSLTHPYGYGSESSFRSACGAAQADSRLPAEYESLGSLVVSFLLIGTALGIGAFLCSTRTPKPS